MTYQYDPMYHRFADYMGIDTFQRKDFELAKKLSLLYEWAQKTSKSEDFAKLTGAMDQARRNLGVTFTGKELTNFMYQRLRLEMDKKEKKEPEPTKREKYEQVLGEGEKIEAAKKGTEQAEKDDQLAKRKNVKYIKKHRESMERAKPKLEKIPVIEHKDPIAEPV